MEMAQTHHKYLIQNYICVSFTLIASNKAELRLIRQGNEWVNEWVNVQKIQIANQPFGIGSYLNIYRLRSKYTCVHNSQSI